MAFLNDLSVNTETYAWVLDEWNPGDMAPRAKGAYAHATGLQFLKLNKNGLMKDASQDVDETMQNSRDSDTSRRMDKWTVGGSMGLRFFHNNGRIFREKAIGQVTPGATLAADTIHAITTSGRVSVIELTTGAGTPERYRPFVIDTTGGREIRSVLAYDALTKKITCGLLEKSHAVDDTCPITFPDASLEAPYSRDSGYSHLLGTVAMGHVPAGKYERRFRGGYVGKWDLKASGSKMDVTAEVYFEFDRFQPGEWGTDGAQTAYDPTQSSLADLPYNAQDAYLVFKYDQEIAGTSQLELVDLASDLAIGIDNHLELEDGILDRRQNKRVFVGASRTVSAALKVRNPSTYPVAAEDFLFTNTDMPLVAEFAQQTASGYVATTMAIPNFRLSKAPEGLDIKQKLSEELTGEGRHDGTSEKLYVWTMIV